jgi:hypothetical protein
VPAAPRQAHFNRCDGAPRAVTQAAFALSIVALSRYLIWDAPARFGNAAKLELSQMDGGLLGGIPLNGPTLIRLAVVLVAAIAVRQLILRFGSKAIESRRDKSRNGKPRR